MAGSHVHILFIEHNAAEVARVRSLLAEEGCAQCTLDHAADLREGLDWLARDHVDVVLLSLSMPEAPGIESLVKVCTRSPDVPVVVLADAQQEAVALDAVARGAQDYLIRGRLDREALLRSIRYALEQRRVLGQLERSTGLLQASQATLQNVIDSNADGLVVIDRHGLICFVNPAAEALLGRSGKDLVGSAFDVQVSAGQRRELTFTAGDGAPRTAEMRVVDIMWEGEPSFLASLRDVTERKRVEQLKDEFLSTVSHELRTPLTSIKGAVTLMLNKSLGAINAEQQDFLQTVSSDLDRLSDLINNLLDLSKMEAGKMRLARERATLPELIDQALRSSQALFGRRSIVRRFGSVPPVYADRHRLLQVLGNLLSNAVKFTADDGVITVELERSGDAVALTVADNGCGMPQDGLGKLFQKFEQLRAPQTDRPRGTGLGLAICREIMELHGGRIYAESDLGHGSRFTCVLPVYDATPILIELLEETRDAVGAAHGEFGLVVVDITGLLPGAASNGNRDHDRLLASCQTFVTKHVARDDRILVMEPSWVMVVAVADRAGLEAMRQRLQKLGSEWAAQEAHGAERGLIVATSMYPHDGTHAAALLQAARLRLAGGRAHG